MFDKIDKFLGYKHWQSLLAIVTILSIFSGGAFALYKYFNTKDDAPTNAKAENCDKPFVYVKGSVSFDRDAKKPEDISTLKIVFKGETEKCNHDISIEDNLSYFVKTEKCKGGEKIKFSISNDGYKIGSNSVVSSTCKISPIRIY